MAGLFEKVTRGSGGGTAEYRHRIGATPGTVAIHTRRATYDVETYYLHRDHLGSGELITNAAGAQVVKLSFSANGERRDTDWDGPVSSGDLAALANATRRGFTDHEHLDSVGLIHMNGRVYDPRIGRFLSRDPYIDGVASSQGANGYAYVWNNPLTRWDPTGYFSITHLDGIAGLEGIIVEATRLVRSAPAFSLLTLGRAAFGGRFDRPDGPDEAREPMRDTDPDAENPEEEEPPESSRIVMCFAEGAAVGAVGAAVVGAVAVGAASLGAPIATVTAGLGVLAIAGGAIVGIDVAASIRNRDWPGLAYDAGSMLGGAAVGGVGGRAVAAGINGVPSRPWSLRSDFAQHYNPRLGSPREWLGTGPNPGSAGATGAAGGAGGAVLADGC